MGQEDSEIPLFIAVAYDRLVDDPLATYRGDCRGGILSGEAGFSARCDEDGDGVTEDLEGNRREPTRQATGTTFGGPTRKMMSPK